MMKTVSYRELEGKSPGFYALFGMLGAILLVGLGAAYYMEHHGHYVTGMTNQIVWGTPHIFAIFLIVAASGALNVASIGSVFDKAIYKPLARLSSLLALALLIGGLAILVLDLGRPDRLIVAMTSYNFKSIFAWNIFLYTGFMAVVGVYLWFMMERRMNKYYPAAGLVAFVWRIILTTGTGSIFGFLVARHAYDEAIFPPMFVIMSFAFGLAVFLLVLIATYNWTERPLGQAILYRLKNLLGVFVASVLYFTLVYHVTNLYITQHHGFEKFVLLGGGGYTLLFWGGHILVGCLVPLFLLYHPGFGKTQSGIVTASICVVLGAFAQLYIIVIGGQAFPLEIFPGYEVTASSFGDANPVHPYAPSLWEVLLGLGGIAIALLVTLLGVRILPFLPMSLADEKIDPHAKTRGINIAAP